MRGVALLLGTSDWRLSVTARDYTETHVIRVTRAVLYGGPRCHPGWRLALGGSLRHPRDAAPDAGLVRPECPGCLSAPSLHSVECSTGVCHASDSTTSVTSVTPQGLDSSVSHWHALSSTHPPLPSTVIVSTERSDERHTPSA